MLPSASLGNIYKLGINNDSRMVKYMWKFNFKLLRLHKFFFCVIET